MHIKIPIPKGLNQIAAWPKKHLKIRSSFNDQTTIIHQNSNDNDLNSYLAKNNQS